MDIITGLVVSFITEAGKAIVRPIGTHFGYLIQYDVNIRALEEQAEKLPDLRVDLERRVEAAERNGEVVDTSVKSWFTRVDRINAELENLKEDTKANPRCLKGWCPNLKSRYSLSKKAKNMSEEVAKLLKEGKFETIATPAPPAKMRSVFADVKGFESRIGIMDEVLHSLKEDTISMIGICGMGGVGKTTMVKEVIKIVERETTFKEVAMAVVSQTLDTRRIQGEIADRLGLEFHVESVRGRAEKLHERLMRSESVLIILDDVWGELDLEEIGIPSRSSHKGCKIIVTTRSKDVLTKMKSQKDVTVSVLSEGEAWDLFVEMAGDSTKQPDLLPIAEEVAKECGGLPLAIVIVGKALRGKIKERWLDARDQLRKSRVSSFTEMNEFVFSRIKLSYNYLGNEQEKSCFLLCCLFPEDFNIPVEYLVRWGVGLSLFKDIDSLYEARNRVYAIIDKLKSLFLLLDGFKEGYVKLHDVVRDFAISIVSEGERLFLVRHDDQLTEWPSEDKCKHCTAISLSCGMIEEYPDAMECPKLELLHVMGKYDMWKERAPLSLPKGMKELKVLAAKSFSIGRHPSSLEVLKNLQSLCLHYCELDNLCFLGALQSLQILSLVGSQIGEFSQELGQLRHLKLLDLTGAGCRIPPGVLSNLIQLEELYLNGVEWQSMQLELKSLSHLKTLLIHIPDARLLPKSILLDDWTRFAISTGDILPFPTWLIPSGNSTAIRPSNSFYPGPNYLEIGGDLRLIVESGINQLSKKTEILRLCGVDNLKNGLYELEGQGFPCLKILLLESCRDLEYIKDHATHTAFPSLESLYLFDLHSLTEIWHGQVPREPRLPCFGNLRHLVILDCCQLKNVFPLSIARGLVHLQHLEVCNCKKVEDIVFSQEENQDGIEFPHLTHLKLLKLPELSSFYNMRDDTSPKDPSLKHQVKSLDSLELSNHDQFEVGPSSSQPKRHLVHNLHILFDSQWISRLPNLNALILEGSKSLDVVFDLGGLSHVEEDRRIEMLAQLTTVRLQSLSKLTSIWKNVPNGFQGLGNLQELQVFDCPNLTQLFPPSIAKLLVRLERVRIHHCSMLESIMAIETEEGKEACNFEWPSLEELVVDNCEKLKTFGSTIQSPRNVNSITDAPTTNDSHLARHSGSQWSCIVCPCLRPKPKSEQSEKHEDSNLDERVMSTNKVKSLDNLGLSNHDQFEVESSSLQPKPHLVHDHHILLDSQWISRLTNLKKLELMWNKLLDVVFDLGGLSHVEEDRRIEMLAQLTKVDLFMLSKLTSIWKNVPNGFQGLGNLQELELFGCPNLTQLFPPSIAKLLVRLERVRMINCSMLESIVAIETEEGKETCNFKWPSLTKLAVIRSEKLKTFGPTIQSPRKVKSNNDAPTTNDSHLARHSGSQWSRIVCPCLRPKLKSEREKHEDSNLDEHERVMSMNEVKSLDGLVVSSSRTDRISEVQHNQFGVGSSSAQPKIHLVPNLHILLDSQWISRLPNLKELDIWGNASLDVIFDLGALSHAEEGRRIEMLAQLTKVKLESLSKLTNIWKNIPNGFQGLGNLQKLEVFECPNLTKLFPPSIAKLLVKLQRVEILNCSMLESIVAIETEEGKEACNFEWPSLKKLHVSRCDKLKKFEPMIQSPRKVKSNNDAPTSSTTNEKHEDSNFDERTFKNEVPSSGLKDSNFTSNIEEICSFLPSSLIHGLQNLQNLQLDSCDSIEVIFDLSELDEKKNHDILVVNALEILTLESLSKLMHIWKVGPKDIEGFQNLRLLIIKRCNCLRNFIPLSIAKLLVKLEKIEIDGCKLMEEVIAEKVKEKKIEKIAFPRLNSIILRNLLNLASFYSGACNIEFPFLTHMEIVGCVKLKTFVLSNILSPKLEKIYMEYVDYPLMGGLNNTIENIFNSQGNEFDQETSESAGQIHGEISEESFE